MGAREIRTIRGEGCGNAYLFVDGHTLDAATARRIERDGSVLTPRWLADGGDPTLDGLILLARDGTNANRRAIVWNADGSRGEVCGNGLRAAARLVRERDGVETGLLRSDAGPHVFSFESDGRVAITMPPPSFDTAAIGLVAKHCHELATASGPVALTLALADGSRVRGHALSMGNPHLVVVHDAPVVGELPAGSELERHPAFARRVNVNRIWSAGADRCGQRTFERGSGETAACGSGACAAAVVARNLGLCGDRVVLEQAGGELEVRLGTAELTLVGPASIADAAPRRLADDA